MRPRRLASAEHWRFPLFSSVPRVALVALLPMGIGAFVDSVGMAYDAYSQPPAGAKKSKRREPSALGSVAQLLSV